MGKYSLLFLLLVGKENSLTFISKVNICPQEIAIMTYIGPLELIRMVDMRLLEIAIMVDICLHEIVIMVDMRPVTRKSNNQTLRKPVVLRPAPPPFLRPPPNSPALIWAYREGIAPWCL